MIVVLVIVVVYSAFVASFPAFAFALPHFSRWLLVKTLVVSLAQGSQIHLHLCL